MKDHWDIFTAIILIFACATTPYYLAFEESDTTGWSIVNNIVDIIFLVDMVLTFNTVLVDDDYRLIEDRKEIARDYFFGWFSIDLLAILPIGLIQDLLT